MRSAGYLWMACQFHVVIGFIFINIERGTRNSTGIKRLNQCFFIDNPSARCVDKKRALLDFFKFTAGDQCSVFLVERYMNRNEIALPQQVVHFAIHASLSISKRASSVCIKYFHAHGLCLLRKLP